MDLKKQRAFRRRRCSSSLTPRAAMGMVEDGVEKIQLAAEAACATVTCCKAMTSGRDAERSVADAPDAA